MGLGFRRGRSRGGADEIDENPNPIMKSSSKASVRDEGARSGSKLCQQMI